MKNWWIRNSPTDGWKWRWKQHDHPKRCYAATSPHGVITQQTTMCIFIIMISWSVAHFSVFAVRLGFIKFILVNVSVGMRCVTARWCHVVYKKNEICWPPKKELLFHFWTRTLWRELCLCSTAVQASHNFTNNKIYYLNFSTSVTLSRIFFSTN
jgi:hypothetical protein